MKALRGYEIGTQWTAAICMQLMELVAGNRGLGCVEESTGRERAGSGVRAMYAWRERNAKDIPQEANRPAYPDLARSSSGVCRLGIQRVKEWFEEGFLRGAAVRWGEKTRKGRDKLKVREDHRKRP